jgi:hypothetical protein
MITSEVLRTDQHLLANEGDQRWGCVGNRGWDSRRTPDLGLGFITPIIMGPLGGLGQTTITARGVTFGLLAVAIGAAGTAIGAYKGAGASEPWAAGGAVIGLLAAGLVNTVLAAVINAKVTAP